ncbi:MAG: diaminopimelate dehydrogenase, partial [Firmicutes bacterium]|nr:diaminopimelate dehydrogenase [Bacillota bacterium]
VECAVKQNEDMELTGVFTRRSPEKIKILTSNVPVLPAEVLDNGCQRPVFDVLVVCSGSARDLPEQTPRYAAKYNIVDSYDNHNKIAEHFRAVNEAAAKGRKTAVICAGWDPGLFSLARAISEAAFPEGKTYTFWGRGVSQGHSEAVRHIKGVKDARQYTVPIEDAANLVRSGSLQDLMPGQKHRRECFVLAEEGADKDRIREEIVSMADYFREYTTSVYFISEEEMKTEHCGLYHGGKMIRSALTGAESEHKALYELSLKMDSNPEFCGGIMCAYARAAFRMNKEGKTGCYTIFDIPAEKIFRESREYMMSLL